MISPVDKLPAHPVALRWWPEMKVRRDGAEYALKVDTGIYTSWRIYSSDPDDRLCLGYASDYAVSGPEWVDATVVVDHRGGRP